MQALDYAINEGFKLSWKGALVGGLIGSAMGSRVVHDLTVKDPSSGMVASIFFATSAFLGVVGGTIGGFVCGVVKGSAEWAISGPFEPHSQTDEGVRLGANLTAIVAHAILSN